MPRGVYPRTEKHRAIARRPRKRTSGGKYVVMGYVHIRCPGHPMAMRNGYAMEHRLIMAEHLGRHLERHEHVHHVNENRSDNRLENLVLMTAGEHCAEHSRGRKYPNRKGREWTDEERSKVREWATGQRRTEEAKRKQSESMKAAWARKRGE